VSVEAITWALKTDTGSATFKAILLVLANYADIHGVCWPSFEAVAKRAECSVSTVQRAVCTMEEKGLLQRTRLRRQDGQWGAYKIHLAMPAGAVEEICDTPEEDDFDPPVNLTAGVKHPPVNLTTGQSDHRSNTTEPPVKLTGLEPNKLSSLRSERTISGGVEARAGEVRETFWPSRLREAQGRAGASLNLTAGGAHTFAELRRLCEPATGHPCDWDLDVLPAVDELAGSFAARGQQFRSWSIVHDAALRNRDRRLAGLPDPKELPRDQHQPARRDSGRPRSSIDVAADLAREFAAAERAKGVG